MHAKSESGFEDVSRSICIDVGGILVSILDPKINNVLCPGVPGQAFP